MKALLIAPWLLLMTFAHASGQQMPIHVFVIAPESFAEYSSLPATLERARQIREFFIREYQLPESNVHMFTDAESTRAHRIRSVLFETLPKLPEKSLIFFFLLTHGDKLDFDSLYSPFDAVLAASDTQTGLLAGTAIRGSELIEAFMRTPRFSRVLAFVDACNSGALTGGSAKLLGAVAEAYGTKMLLVASSGAGELSYAANFTSELLTVWENNTNECLGIEALLDKINAKLGDNQHAEVVVDYGGLCLNSVNDATALLLASNTRKQPVKLNISGFPPKFVRASTGFSIIPMPKGKYNVSVQSGGGGEKIEYIDQVSLDLMSRPVIYYEVPSTEQAANSSEQYASAAEAITLFGYPEIAREFYLVSAGFARIAGEEQRALEIERRLGRAPLSEELQVALGYRDNQDIPRNINAREVARYLRLSGRPKDSATVLEVAKASAPNQPGLFQELYTSYVRAGEAEKARDLRKKNPGAFIVSSEAVAVRAIFNAEENDRESRMFLADLKNDVQGMIIPLREFDNAIATVLNVKFFNILNEPVNFSAENGVVTIYGSRVLSSERLVEAAYNTEGVDYVVVKNPG